jgi:hypothetical protein
VFAAVRGQRGDAPPSAGFKISAGFEISSGFKICATILGLPGSIDIHLAAYRGLY